MACRLLYKLFIINTELGYILYTHGVEKSDGLWKHHQHEFQNVIVLFITVLCVIACLAVMPLVGFLGFFKLTVSMGTI